MSEKKGSRPEKKHRVPEWIKPKRLWRGTKAHSTIILLAVIIVLVCIMFFGNAGKTIFTSRTIDFGLSDIGELATQAGYYTNINSIAKPDRTIGGVPIPGTSSKAIMTYQGVIRAGLDFNEVEMSVDTTNKIVTLNMPAPRILSNEVDMDSCEIYDEQSSIFNQIDISAFNQSLTEMKTKAEEQAKQNKILESAKSNAEIIVRTMFDSDDTTEGYQLIFKWPKEE